MLLYTLDRNDIAHTITPHAHRLTGVSPATPQRLAVTHRHYLIDACAWVVDGPELELQNYYYNYNRAYSTCRASGEIVVRLGILPLPLALPTNPTESCVPTPSTFPLANATSNSTWSLLCAHTVTPPSHIALLLAVWLEASPISCPSHKSACK